MNRVVGASASSAYSLTSCSNAMCFSWRQASGNCQNVAAFMASRLDAFDRAGAGDCSHAKLGLPPHRPLSRYEAECDAGMSERQVKTRRAHLGTPELGTGEPCPVLYSTGKIG